MHKSNHSFNIPEDTVSPVGTFCCRSTLLCDSEIELMTLLRSKQHNLHDSK